MDRLKGKRALITGGSSGIGLETARQFAAEGAKVAITAPHPEAFQAVRREFGDALLYIASDAADASNQRTVAETIKEHFGSLDILFVNAGVTELKPVDAWDEAAYDRSFRTNVRGPFFLIQALLPVFGNPASIILNASINAHIGMPNTSVYGATKAALLSLARTLSGELISPGIRVNAVSPGPIETPIFGRTELPQEVVDQFAEQFRTINPMKRFGKPEEVGHAVLFLASSEASYVTGVDLNVDGGSGQI
jgi:NAD(P)-dependent dehydrogenase (short-subunit alcohol dehydrogenase family)